MLTLGIDEVGRGAWAGPLTVGAVVFDSVRVPEGLRDSKKLTKKRREMLARAIKTSAVVVGVGWVDAGVLDRIGLSAALKLATERAFAQIPPAVREKLDQIIIDGTIKLLDDPRATTLIKADSKIAAVSAAAIVAKVFRDDYMARLSQVFPDYDFEKHVGYGTALHREKLTKFGALAGVHRQSFAPIKSDKISQTAGRVAENAAAEYLEQHGHQIIAQNWRTKFCEIDIISARDQTIHFTEVKYRQNARHGDGLAAITPKKLKQMKFAAEFYLLKNADYVKNHSARLAAISLSGNPPRVEEFVENIT